MFISFCVKEYGLLFAQNKLSFNLASGSIITFAAAKSDFFKEGFIFMFSSSVTPCPYKGYSYNFSELKSISVCSCKGNQCIESGLA